MRRGPHGEQRLPTEPRGNFGKPRRHGFSAGSRPRPRGERSCESETWEPARWVIPSHGTTTATCRCSSAARAACTRCVIGLNKAARTVRILLPRVQHVCQGPGCAVRGAGLAYRLTTHPRTTLPHELCRGAPHRFTNVAAAHEPPSTADPPTHRDRPPGVVDLASLEILYQAIGLRETTFEVSEGGHHAHLVSPPPHLSASAPASAPHHHPPPTTHHLSFSAGTS